MPDADGTPRPVRMDSSPASVRLEVARSLERLGTDRIDLIQVHGPDPDTPIAETMGALADLMREGKVRAIGVSNYSVEQLDGARIALGSVPLASDQPQYSLLERGIERDVLPWARQHDVGLLVYAPLCQGLLSGRMRENRAFQETDRRQLRAEFQPENRRTVNALLDAAVAPVAARHGATVAQVVLAWTASRPGVTAALAGARTREQVEENAAAGALELSPEEAQAIDAAFAEVRLRRPGRSLLRRAKDAVRRVLGS
jgi:aryl-alcohol dehydrogenase-like predicted oxidoreductase